MGPLSGIRIIEIAGIGPGPFAGMMLADMGADVLRIDRALAGATNKRDRSGPSFDLLARGRKSIGVDLKHPEGRKVVLRMVESADALIEGFRPGVMERLQLGPAECLAQNAKLVYGRMTGFGQTGPFAQVAGHDIDYIALSGALHAIGRAGEAPVPPLNLVGDFGGGGMLLAFGVVCALLEAKHSGQGQVIDAAMCDGSSLLMMIFHGFAAQGFHNTGQRGQNLLDTGAHFYEVYETLDGKHLAVGAIEPQFYAELLKKLEIDPSTLPRQMDRASWPMLKQLFKQTIKKRTQAAWCAIFEGSDACVAPVLSIHDAPAYPHNAAREAFIEVGGIKQPAPAPRFSRTPAAAPAPPSHPGADTDAGLAAWGFSEAEIRALREQGAVA
jgi:alpha-methylacyl-CoA racemase